MFRVVILGSGASLPTLARHPASVAVQYRGDVFLFDCGEGTQLQWRRAGLRFGRLRSVLISHLHGDHVNGLVGLLQTLSLSDRKAPLDLFGPVGIAAYWKALTRYQGVRLGYPLEIHESGGGTLLEADGYTIDAEPLDHGPPTLGFALSEGERPGRFDVEAARALGLEPGPEYGRLQAGEPVACSDGTTIRPEQVLGPPRPGRRLAYCIDTRPCDGAAALAKGASLLLHDSTFGSELEREAHTRGHATAAQAARLALDAGAARLLLTHISARYHDTRPLLAEARAVFPTTEVAVDLLEVQV